MTLLVCLTVIYVTTFGGGVFFVVSRNRNKAMAALDDAITALTTAVSSNTTATNSLISALAAASPSADQIAAIGAQTTAVEANTTAINNALTPPTPEQPVS